MRLYLPLPLFFFCFTVFLVFSKLQGETMPVRKQKTTWTLFHSIINHSCHSIMAKVLRSTGIIFLLYQWPLCHVKNLGCDVEAPCECSSMEDMKFVLARREMLRSTCCDLVELSENLFQSGILSEFRLRSVVASLLFFSFLFLSESLGEGNLILSYLSSFNKCLK